MQAIITNEKKEQSTYSIDNYEGLQKWCFAIVLNKGLQNLNENEALLNHSLLLFEKTQKKEWFNEETEKLIVDNKEEMRKRFENLRNYFSHYLHSKDCLYFEKDDTIRIILEKAYEKACFEWLRKNTEVSIEFPQLFDADNKITSAGVVLLTSFFVERRFLNRLMGYVKGFKKNEGQWNITRKVFSTYCLRDSYSIQGQDDNLVHFRNILGYLLRIPSEAYQYYYPNEPNGHEENGRILNERKTEKFISFAVRCLEDFPPEGYTLKFARRKIEQPQVKPEDENKPHRKKKRVMTEFDEIRQDDPYYINNNNVILEITDNNNNKRICKIGVNELKYLVLLALSGKGREALGKINGYVEKIGNIDLFVTKKDSIEKNRRYLPGFILRQHGIEKRDEKGVIENRKKYIREKWDKKKEKSKQATLHEKARDILQYLNECCKRPLNVDEYNKIFEILINKNIEGFQSEMSELQRSGILQKSNVQSFEGLSKLEQIQQKVCDIILDKLDKLEDDELLTYIGLKRKDLRKTEEQINKEKYEIVYDDGMGVL